MTSHKEQSLHTERVASLGSVSLHAHEQKIVTRIDEIDFNCVDEGYPTSETAYGRIRAAGEDVGMVMAIAGVLQTKGLLENFTPSELLERYITAKSIKAQEKKAKINYHTDTHKEAEHRTSERRHRKHQAHAIGCGHIGQAVSGNSVYNIPSNYTHRLFERLETLHEMQQSSVNKTVLDREHDAIGIIFIDENSNGSTPNWTLQSRGRNGDNYFIVDVGRTKHFLRHIVPALRIPDITADEVVAMYTIQAMETLTHVIPHGKLSLPIYSVSYENTETPVVKFISEVKRK